MRLGFTRYTDMADPAVVKLATDAVSAFFQDANECPNMRREAAMRELPFAVYVALHPSPQELQANSLYGTHAAVVARRQLCDEQRVFTPFDNFFGHYLALVGIGHMAVAHAAVTPRGF